MTACRTVDEAYAAGCDAAADCKPLTQEQADYVAAICASAVPEKRAA